MAGVLRTALKAEALKFNKENDSSILIFSIFNLIF